VCGVSSQIDLWVRLRVFFQAWRPRLLFNVSIVAAVMAVAAVTLVITVAVEFLLDVRHPQFMTEVLIDLVLLAGLIAWLLFEASRLSGERGYQVALIHTYRYRLRMQHLAMSSAALLPSSSAAASGARMRGPSTAADRAPSEAFFTPAGTSTMSTPIMPSPALPQWSAGSRASPETPRMASDGAPSHSTAAALTAIALEALDSLIEYMAECDIVPSVLGLRVTSDVFYRFVAFSISAASTLATVLVYAFR